MLDTQVLTLTERYHKLPHWCVPQSVTWPISYSDLPYLTSAEPQHKLTGPIQAAGTLCGRVADNTLTRDPQLIVPSGPEGANKARAAFLAQAPRESSKARNVHTFQWCFACQQR